MEDEKHWRITHTDDFYGIGMHTRKRGLILQYPKVSFGFLYTELGIRLLPTVGG